MKTSLSSIFYLALVLLFAGAASANVNTPFPDANPGPPFYAFLDRPPQGEIFQDGAWAAIVWVRNPACVPADFNLLDGADLTPAFGSFGPPRAFQCELTVHGHAIWKNGPAPIDPAPIQVTYQGNGTVPVWFAHWDELQAAIADDTLTVGELAGLPSLEVGSALFMEAVQQPGLLRPQGLGNGKIELAAFGRLVDGRFFQIEVREMGVNQVSTLRHIRIAFR